MLVVLRKPTQDTQLATPAPEAGSPRQGHGPFDTFRFVTELEHAGVPRDQAVAMMEQVLLAISEANTRQIALVRRGCVEVRVLLTKLMSCADFATGWW